MRIRALTSIANTSRLPDHLNSPPPPRPTTSLPSAARVTHTHVAIMSTGTLKKPSRPPPPPPIHLHQHSNNTTRHHHSFSSASSAILTGRKSSRSSDYIKISECYSSLNGLRDIGLAGFKDRTSATLKPSTHHPFGGHHQTYQSSHQKSRSLIENHHQNPPSFTATVYKEVDFTPVIKMKKSFMNNLKNFVDSNVLHRIDRVSHNSGNNNNSDPLSDDLLVVERHFDDLRQFCVDTEKKISNMLQSIQISSTTPSQLGAYTQNVQAGLNNLSHNLAQQAANITLSTSSSMGSDSNNLGTIMYAKSCDGRNSSTSNLESNVTFIKSSNQNVISPIQQHSHQELNIIDPPTELKYDALQKFKKLPIVGFYKSLCKSGSKIKQDSLLATTLTHCSKLQAQLTNLYLIYEQMIDTQCLKPIQLMLEVDIPNVLKLKKLYLKAQYDFESVQAKYNGASQKQQQQQLQYGHSNNTTYLVSQSSNQQSNANKLELLKNELDEYITRFEQSKDIYEAELFAFVCREPELVNLLRLFYQLQSGYHQRMVEAIQSSMPTIDVALDRTPRKFVFGTPLNEHIRCTGRKISPVIELCVYFLHSQGLKEEGLFRIPGSSVKIKKLKNGINALFLTLISISELQSDQQREDGHSCIVSLHDLFKSAVGQRPRNDHQLDAAHPAHQSSVLRSSLAVDETPMSHTIYSTSNHVIQQDSNNDDYIMDVHSIAGLLKLYLRELPEPLFTHTLYDNWVGCVSIKSESSERRLKLLAEVIGQLPSANYANLKHLIKFLNKLSHFHEQNKMTSTNLAIAMAPSLLWPKPNNDHEQRNDMTSNPDDAQALNQQMCSFGLSASQHAMILEALINHADILFPESVDFEPAELTNLSLKTSMPKRTASTRGGRAVKSTSPTGLSTASSSSFSSNTSNSAAPTTSLKGHSRKGGSMEGLLGGGGAGSGQDQINAMLQPNMSTRSIGRPVSVQIRRDDYSCLVNRENIASPAVVPPSKPPPVPIARSHLKATIDTRSGPVSKNNKPPAPPVPPPTSIRHQQERLKLSAASPLQSASSDSSNNKQAQNKPRPVSLRGTGTIEQQQQPASNSCNQVKTRPSVPPPDRPATVAAVVKVAPKDGSESSPHKCKSVDDLDAKSANSLTSSGSNLRNDFEEINPNEVEEIEAVVAQSASPVLSLDEVSANDDSSFDDSDGDNVSLDPSWTKCFSNPPGTVVVSMEHQEGNSGTLRKLDFLANNSGGDDVLKPDLRGRSSEDNIDRAQQNLVQTAEAGQEERRESQPPESARPQPPAKPPRSASPKLTQSTPL